MVPLPLCSDNTGQGVPDLLDRLLRRLLRHTDGETAQDEQGGLLTSLVGLAVKRGSTPKVFEAIRTVLRYGGANAEVEGEHWRITEARASMDCRGGV